MSKRYELSDAEWEIVEALFTAHRRPRVDDRLMLKRLHLKLNAQGQIDLTTWCTDSIAVRATRASAGAGKKGGLKNQRTTHLDEAGAG